MQKKEDIELWLSYIRLNTSLMRMKIARGLSKEKMDKIDGNNYIWYLDKIDYTIDRIKKMLAD